MFFQNYLVKINSHCNSSTRLFSCSVEGSYGYAWKQPLTSDADNFEIHKARIRIDRNDALRIVKDDATEQEWEGDDGVSV